MELVLLVQIAMELELPAKFVNNQVTICLALITADKKLTVSKYSVQKQLLSCQILSRNTGQLVAGKLM